MARLAIDQGIYRQTCFHAQQAVEKALKAFLLFRTGTYPRTTSDEDARTSLADAATIVSSVRGRVTGQP